MELAELEVKAKEMAVKHAKALAIDLVSEILPEALDLAAKQSKTPIDDAIVAMLKEPLKQTLLDLLAKA
jgi:hypothetical protein